MKHFLLLISIALYGCGGSDGGGETEPPKITPTSFTINGKTEAYVGDSVDFTVAAPKGSSIKSIQWAVSGVEDVHPLAAHTQAIGFDATSPGDYLVSAEVTFSTGDVLTQSITLSANEGDTPQAILRLGHEASEGGRVSLHVDNNSVKTVQKIEWKQLSGPNVSAFSFDDENLSYNIYFQAPSVTSDEVIEIEANLIFDDGTQASDVAQVLVKNIEIEDDAYFVDDSGAIPQTVSSHMVPYNENSPYAASLQKCVYNNKVSDSCTFGTLPLIGQVTESPSINDILDRTYVSHPWMGDAFKDFLETSSSANDILDLLRATTAVVISYDVRPSFYWAVTGAIYLDANNFWRTPEERDTLNTQPDYRTNFDQDLQFKSYWRYVRNEEYYYPQPGLVAENRATRSRQGVEAALTWLLYHELAHANDFFDYTKWSSLSNNDTPLAYVNRVSPLSPGLHQSYPLTSAQLHGLAQVRYGGETATSTQKQYTAQQVALWFEQDSAASFYSYYNEREDFATLVERFMMLYRMGVSADTGVFTKEAVDDQTYQVTWGQRNRINDEDVQLRVNYAVSRVLPNLNVPAIQQTLPSPQLFPINSTWFSTLSLDASTPSPELSTEEKERLIKQHNRFPSAMSNRPYRE